MLHQKCYVKNIYSFENLEEFDKAPSEKSRTEGSPSDNA